MKKIKHLLLFFALLSVLFAVCSCKASNKDKNNGGTEAKKNLIYSSDTQLSLIFADGNVSELAIADFYNAIFSYNNNVKLYNGTVPKKGTHEIIIGKCDREVSKRAYDVLERHDFTELGDVGYVFYSDGSSIAMAYTEGLNYSFVEDALYKFAETHLKKELILAPGTVMQDYFNIMESVEADDAARMEAAFKRVEAAAGAEVANAMRDLYAIYTPGIISWFANLYEKRICVCTTTDENGLIVCQHPTDENGEPLCQYGGFYYSNSGRDTEGYAPDIESTNQALSFLESSGMLATLGGRYANAIPDWMKNEIVAFVKGLQDESGYFYHPQWSRELHHQNPERMGRDLSWATSILKNLGANPYYTTPGGALTGEGKTSPVALTDRLGTSSVSSVSKVVATSSLNAHLSSPEAFKQYLAGLNIKTNSYGAGSAVGAQTTTIKELDRKLAGITDGKNFDYRNKGVYSKILLDWLDENQNPENGLWDADSDYQACDGLFKIVNIYNDYGLPMKYPLEAALATIAAISSDEPVYTVCNMYNAWANVGLIKKNLRENMADKTAAEELISTINAAITAKAPEAIKITKEKTSNFLIIDGSFSYLIGHSSDTSTGMPTAVVNSYEGDVNATLICTGGLIGHINNALDLPKVNPYGLADWYRFCDIIESNNNSVKDDTLANVTLDFELESVGYHPSGVDISVNSEGSISVAKDPKKSSNKVLQINHPYAPGKGDSAKFRNYTYELNRTCSIFDSDFLITSEGTDSTYVAQIMLGAYTFTFRIANGKLGIWEDTSTELVKTKARHLADVDLDKWFNLRIEYYKGDHETVRIKVYVNEALVAVSAAYTDMSGANIKNETGKPKRGIEAVTIYPLSYVNLNMYLDNVIVTSKNIDYVSEADTEGLVVNEDIAPKDRVTYTFDREELPEGYEILSGGANLSAQNGELTLAKDGTTTKFTVPRTTRCALPNCYAFGFDIDFSSATDGEVLTFAFTEPYHYEGKIIDITRLSLKCITEGGEKYLVVTSKDGATTYASTKISANDEPVSLEFVYFTKQKQTLIYKNGEFIGLSDFVLVSNPHQYELGYITVTHKGKLDATLDNVFCEARRGDYETEIKPDVEREDYVFDGAIPGDLTTSGEIIDDRLALLDKDSVKIPVNLRVDSVVSYEFFIDAHLSAGGERTRVTFEDKSGNTVFALQMSYDGEALSFYEETKDAVLNVPVATFFTNGEIGLTFNYYPEDGIVTCKVGDTYVLATSIMYGNVTPAAAFATVTSSTMSIGSLYLEGLVFNYPAPKIEGVTEDDTAEQITYEYSSTGKLPSRITATLVTASASSRIALMMREVAPSKVLAFTTSAGGNDYIDFVLPVEEKPSKIEFESDIYFDIDGYYEINVLNSTDGSKNSYRAVLSGRKGKLYYYDTASNGGANPGSEVAIANLGEWVRFKLVFDLGDGTAGSAKILTYINDELVYESQNYIGSHNGTPPAATYLNRFRFYTHSSSNGTLYFDNTTFKEAGCLHTTLIPGEIITEPTCTAPGARELVCSDPDCSYKRLTAVDALGHDMGEWVQNEATWTERSDCSRCDHYEEKEMPPYVPSPDDTYGDNDYMDGTGWTEIGGN